MDYTNAILTTINRPPDGWPKELSIEEYSTLGTDRRYYYQPIYAKYRTKKVRDYDPDYGNFLGWRPIEIGIGEPTGYKYVGYIAAKAIDQINSSNVLMGRILKNERY